MRKQHNFAYRALRTSSEAYLLPLAALRTNHREFSGYAHQMIWSRIGLGRGEFLWERTRREG